MSSPEYELLKVVVSATCEGFGNLLLVIELEDSSGLGLKSLVVKRKDASVFFPAVAGQISKNNCYLNGITKPATCPTLSAAIEENVVLDPLKIVISVQSWAANLVVYGKSIKKVLKVASLIDNVWEVDKEFFEMTKTLSSYGKSDPGGVKLCCGITQEEYNLAKRRGSLTQARERTYPGGSIVFEDCNCERLVNITFCTILPTFPFPRCSKCSHWFQRNLKRNAEKLEEQLSCNVPSKKLYTDSCANNPSNITSDVGSTLNATLLPISGMSPSNIRSSTNMSKLTPLTRKKRLYNLRKKRMQQKTEILRLRKKLVKLEVALSKEQSKELENIVSTIDMDFKDVLENVLDESPKNKAHLRRIWQRDRQARHNEDVKTFQADQKSNVTGHRGNKWSMITYRIALAVYIRSPAAYEALKSFRILNLPCESSLKYFTSHRLENAGLSHTYIQSQQELYELKKAENKRKGLKEPLGEGILIFDEVRVIAKVMWNSKNHEVTGFAMSEEDFTMLGDIYDSVSGKKESQTTYILQFLFRDLSSNFDVLGPYFTFDGSANRKQLYSCLMSTIRLFEFHDFHIRACVCDGASTNLSIIKFTMGHAKKAFGKSADKSSDWAINPSFPNPFWPPNRINWIICPTHQMKNMINALFSSNGPDYKKKFETPNGLFFGWKVIENHYDREVIRMKQGLPKLVDGLQKSYIERDSWTKLNVKPAKIMQQEGMIQALTHYAKPSHSDPPKDSPEVLAVLDYLKSCNLMFERGILQRCQLWRLDHPVIDYIKKGFEYFKTWLEGLQGTDEEYNFSRNDQKKFISWQTWDLLRVMYFGFLALCEEYLSANPGYFINPGRVNGSAVETLFSQFKFSASGKLSGINYATARRAYLMKNDVHGRHFAHGDYLKAPLAVANVPLEKKKQSKV